MDCFFGASSRCGSGCAIGEVAMVQHTTSKDRRARRYRHAFLAGAACVRRGPPGLVSTCGGSTLVWGEVVQCNEENRGLPDAEVPLSDCEGI